MDRIEHIWKQLENDSSAIPGLFKTRYSDTSKCPAFLGIKSPESNRMLIIRAPFISGKNFNLNYEFKGLRFEKIYDPEDPNYVLLNLLLINNYYTDVYNALVYNILTAIINESDISVILKIYTNRLIKWQSLFERYNQQGLSAEEQRGLFGELYFLRKFLKTCDNYQYVLNTWIGSAKETRDFQMNLWALEVKTTHGNNHQKVQISSERQLDNTHLEKLFLYHLSLEKSQGSGETLNQIIASINILVSSDAIALNQFNSKLYESGYFVHHQAQYEPTGYFIRQDTTYLVENEFPRIMENEVRRGVGDVKYSIIISQCESFIVPDHYVFETLKL
jgi:hypothetical protein